MKNPSGSAPGLCEAGTNWTSRICWDLTVHATLRFLIPWGDLVIIVNYRVGSRKFRREARKFQRRRRQKDASVAGCGISLFIRHETGVQVCVTGGWIFVLINLSFSDEVIFQSLYASTKLRGT
ncbi:hypothetical protein TWF225_001349 [Orbilia oligospora]|uniref:Uncharacterized protein n=1 Tax=Orbilia oligospora TaxID=2813651 RepID=A0A7C8K9F7_ORBOL|nr:hypothetical protein TWF751_008886 [Orbilia oligospora]KAF3191188.1 hypothetical protein TWF225_001349 [Orbilia oligospora]KAF3238711.1 hypothetical protein TWF128_011965 [Orbilia oligospora]KAF3279294.1 hypothetical protein TWF132_000659 [Orbilia oligospora]TGJ66054.1 hypothetical protein EYR41_007714 [Orbilia oligospora]